MRITTWFSILIILVSNLLTGSTGFGRPQLQNSKLVKSTTTASGEVNTTDEVKLYLPILSTRAMISSFGIENVDYKEGEMLDLINIAGVSWARFNALLWSEIEPQKGQRLWSAASKLETEMKLVSENRKEIILIIRATPEWARLYPDSPCGPMREDQFQSFASFVYDAVKRYSQPPYSVHYYEIWNEPDAPVINMNEIYGCWGDASDQRYYGGRYYARMLKQVYPALKAANPQATGFGWLDAGL